MAFSSLGHPQVGANGRGISCYVHLPRIETIVKQETTDRHRVNALNSKSPLIGLQRSVSYLQAKSSKKR